MRKLLVLLTITLTLNGCSTYQTTTYRPGTFEWRYNFIGNNPCWNSTFNNFTYYGNWWVRPYTWNYSRPTRPHVYVPRRGRSNQVRPVQTTRPTYRTTPSRTETRVRPSNSRSNRLRKNNL